MDAFYRWPLSPWMARDGVIEARKIVVSLARLEITPLDDRNGRHSYLSDCPGAISKLRLLHAPLAISI